MEGEEKVEKDRREDKKTSARKCKAHKSCIDPHGCMYSLSFLQSNSLNVGNKYANMEAKKKPVSIFTRQMPSKVATNGNTDQALYSEARTIHDAMLVHTKKVDLS